MNNPPIKILIVDDHKMFLGGLAALLHDEQNIHITDTAHSGTAAMQSLSEHETDILVTDISMPEMDGIELIRLARKKYPNLKTLVLSTHNDAEILAQLIKLNVNGYLLKNAEKEELMVAIESIYNGQNYFSAEVKNEFINKTFESVGKKTTDIPKLSRRELEILKLIVEEYTTSEVAQKLFISQNTVNTHRKNLLAKLDVKNTAGLVKYALENKLIS